MTDEGTTERAGPSNRALGNESEASDDDLALQLRLLREELVRLRGALVELQRSGLKVGLGSVFGRK